MRKTTDSLINSLQSFLGETFSKEELRSTIRFHSSDYGDLSLPCHKLAAELEHKGKEDEIAQWLLEHLKLDASVFDRAERKGSFINFYLNKSEFTKRTLDEITEKGDSFGKLDIGNGKLVVLDYSGPNIGKPLHIGHIRSTILGDSVIKILKKAGYTTHGINYLGDSGLHLGKLLYSYQKHVDLENLKKNPDEEMLRLYVKFGEEHEKYVSQAKTSLEQKITASPEDEDLEQIESPLLKEAKDIQKRIEAGDPEMLKILDIINAASMKSFDEVYSLLDTSFDEVTGQSKFSEKGRKIVKKALEEGLAELTPEGAVIINKLKDYGIPPKIVLRSDGAVIYSTQDLGAAHDRYEKFHFDKLVYVVAEEQSTYFKQIFKILELMGNPWAKDCHHLSFGMINLAEEKMSSRKGNIIYLKDVLKKAVDYSEKLIKDPSITDDERKMLARTVGIGAIKYMVLGVDPIKTIQFSWERALDLNANSSPYIQYTYARANSLTKGKDILRFDPAELSRPIDFELIKKLSEYPLHVEAAAKSFKPNLIANYSYDLAKAYTRFYHNGKVIGSNEEQSRLYITECFKKVLANSLDLLGIDVPERM